METSEYRQGYEAYPGIYKEDNPYRFAGGGKKERKARKDWDEGWEYAYSMAIWGFMVDTGEA